MIFNISYRIEKDVTKKRKTTALIKYFIENKNFPEELGIFIKKNNLKINSILLNNFIDKNGKDLSNYVESKCTDKIILKKVELDEKFNSDFFRNHLSGIITSHEKENIDEIKIIIPSFNEYKKYFKSEEYFYQTFAEGVMLGNYTFDLYKSEKRKKKKLDIVFICDNMKKINAAISTAKIVIDSVYFARDLVNEPAISLTPKELYIRSKKELIKYNVRVTAFNQVSLKKKKMNSILAVGNASDNPPYLITIHYKPEQKSKKKIALVGKGVTYDSGGLSIKPTSGMLEMKADMAGAAIVIGTIRAAAMAKLPFEIIGVIPAVENMLSGKSFKPSDIIKTASGKSIEVKDTDAEGRIILADALEYASKQKPDEILDFATLTGAIAVALGLFTSGLFTKNDEMAARLLESSQTTYELLWRMPFFDEFNSLIESDIADISNLGPRWGGAITAGKFLEFFVDKKIPWAHLDVAGPVIKHKFKNYTEKYDTGYGVRLMYDYLSKI